MKPILIRTKDESVSTQIAKQFKGYMKKRSGIDSVANINMMQHSPNKAFKDYYKLINTSSFLILTNIKASDLFINDYPFYKNNKFCQRLIFCTVVDDYTEPIFPKGFRTINLDPLVTHRYIRQELINNYSYIAYLKACFSFVNIYNENFNQKEKNEIQNIFRKDIRRTDRKIHSLISTFRNKSQVYQSAI